MNTNLEQKRLELAEINNSLIELRKRKKAVYNYIYTTEKRQKEKKV
jgi:hypothetical protein